MSQVVEHVFTELATTYGSAWDRSLGNAPIADVKTKWANKLDSFTGSIQSKKRVLWALQNLPEKCPNVIEFCNLCRQAPSEEPIALPLPVVNPEIAKMVIEGTKKVLSGPQSVDFRAWAKLILRDHKGGLRRSTPTAVAMARRAMGEEV